MKLSVRERILAKILIDSKTGCWNWQGFRDPHGYGRMGIGKRTSVLVHRAAWDAWGGMVVVAGFELHHICENKPCCNPDHLRYVSHREHVTELSPNNVAFKSAAVTHCPFGHEYPTTVTVLGSGKRARICRPCARRRVREFYLRHPEKLAVKKARDAEQRKKNRANKTHNRTDASEST